MHIYLTMDNATSTWSTYQASTTAELVESNNTSTFNLAEKKNNSVINSSVMFSVGVVSNLLALLVLKRTDNDNKRKLFYRLVAGLTLTDLTGTVALSPVVISVYVNNFKWTGGEALCKYFAFMMVFAGAATMTIVCLMSVERLLSIYHPYLSLTRLRKSHATYFLLGAWTFAAICACLPLLGFGTYIRQYPGTWCFFDYYTYDKVDRGFNYLFAILALSTISVTVTCNVIVLHTLFKTKMIGKARRKNGNSRTFNGYSRRFAECQMAVQLIGVTIVFSSCYLPLMMRILINQTKLLPVDRKLDLLVIRFASLNQILDPWVYILLRREVVWKVVSTIKAVVGKSPPEESNSTTEIRRKSSSVSLLYEKQERQTCCNFCWHCLCDPPPSRERTRSLYSDFSQKSVYSPSPKLSPAINLAMGSAQNGILLTNLISKQDNNNRTRRKLNKQVSFEAHDLDDVMKNSSDDLKTVTSQPPRYVRLSVRSDGSEKSNESNVESNGVCDTLLEKSETSEDL